MLQTLGVPLQAEIIPCEPDADNAAEGKSRNRHPLSAIPKVFIKYFKGMEITFNNQTCQIEAKSSIQIALNNWIGDKQKGIAVAVNETVVPKAQWDSYELQHNDNVLVIKATQGG